MRANLYRLVRPQDERCGISGLGLAEQPRHLRVALLSKNQDCNPNRISNRRRSRGVNPVE
jgi:hypothetical protein